VIRLRHFNFNNKLTTLQLIRADANRILIIGIGLNLYFQVCEVLIHKSSCSVLPVFGCRDFSIVFFGVGFGSIFELIPTTE
jgi:hypothetical protein